MSTRRLVQDCSKQPYYSKQPKSVNKPNVHQQMNWINRLQYIQRMENQSRTKGTIDATQGIAESPE